MPGPPPKPTAALRLSGSWRANTRKGEPTLPVETPECPAWLEGKARDTWPELVQLLAPMRVLTKADGLALAQFAEYLARWKDCTAAVTRFGEVLPIRDDEGNVVSFKRSPYTTLQMEYGVMLNRAMQQFGLTPSARARLSQPNEAKQIDAIFSRKAALGQ